MIKVKRSFDVEGIGRNFNLCVRERFLVRSNTVCHFRILSILYIRAVFNCFGFTLLRSMIGLKNSRHLLSQSDVKPKLIATWSHAFSRAWRRLRVFASSSHWFIALFTFVVIGHCNCFYFGFTTLNCKPLYSHLTSNVTIVVY